MNDGEKGARPQGGWNESHRRTDGFLGDTEEGLGVKDQRPPEYVGAEGTFRGGEKYGGTERGRLVAEMKAEREERSRSRRGSPNRLARYDMGASAKVYGLRALACIVEIMEDEGEASAVRLAAAREVLDRGFGRSKQVTEVSGVDGDEIRNRLVIEFVGVPRVGGGKEGEWGSGAQSGNGPVGASYASRMNTRPESEVNARWMQGIAEQITQVEPGVDGKVEDVEPHEVEEVAQGKVKPPWMK